MNCLEFLKKIYHTTTEGYTYLWSLTTKRTNAFSLKNLEEICKIGQNLNMQGNHVSFSMGILNRPLGTHMRAKDVDIVAIPCLWCDIDIASEVHGQSQKLAPDLETALSFIPSDIPPSIVVNSGFGIHAYWIFEELLSTKTDTERFRAKKLLTQLQSVIRYRAGEYFVDPTADLSRMLRLPDTINWKAGNKEDAPRCHVIDASDICYQVDELEAILNELTNKPKTGNPREISDSQRESVLRDYTPVTAENQAFASDSAEKLFENCAFCRFCRDNIHTLSQPDFVNFFPNLLKASDGKEIALDLCRQWLGNNFDLAKSQKQIESLANLTPITCDRIATLYSVCNSSSCIVANSGKKSPCAILLSPTVKKQINPNSVAETFPDAPDFIRNLKIPTGFSLGRTQVIDERGKSPKSILDTPVIISREIVSADNDSPLFYELTYLKRNIWKKCLVKPNMISDSKLLVTNLPNEGILISSKQAGIASEYLNAFIRVNENQIPCIKSFSKLGWHGKEFILPSLNEGSYLIQDHQSNIKIKRAGSRDVSIQLLREISKYPYARLIVDANLAAPLLELVGCRNFILDLICTSHSGKSTAMIFANSLWGSQQWMANFNATTNAAEEFGANRNSLPTNINEWQMTNSKNREEIANQIVHRFSEGEGRSRLNRDGTPKSTKSWHGIMIMTAEEPLTGDNVFQGVKTRTLEIQTNTVIGLKKDGVIDIDQALCKRIWRETRLNYGHLGAEYIVNLQREIAENPDLSDLRRENQAYFELVMKSRREKIIASYAEYIAVLAMAHFRIDKYFLGLSDQEATDSTFAFIVQNSAKLPAEEDISDVERAKYAILDWIAAYSEHFSPWIEPESNENAGIYDRPLFKRVAKDPCFGFWIHDNLYVIPSELRRILKERGYSDRKIVKEWAMNRDIEVSDDGKNLSTVKKDASGNSRRVIGLTFLHDFDAPSSDSDEKDVPDEALPF